MKKEQIQQLFGQFENACYDYKGIECWSARELQSIFNYTEWRNFLKVIDKAREACKNSGNAVSDHFVDVNKMIELAKSAQREIEDIALTTNDMKRKLQVPGTRPLADFLPTLTIKAKDFATELTSHNVTEKDLKGENAISKEHVDNNLAVRKMLIQRGVKPEQLPPAEDLKKVQRRLYGEEKKVLKDAKKKKSK